MRRQALADTIRPSGGLATQVAPRTSAKVLLRAPDGKQASALRRQHLQLDSGLAALEAAWVHMAEVQMRCQEIVQVVVVIHACEAQRRRMEVAVR